MTSRKFWEWVMLADNDKELSKRIKKYTAYVMFELPREKFEKKYGKLHDN